MKPKSISDSDFLPPSCTPSKSKAQRVLDVLERLEGDAASFSQKAGLGCLADCGHCCTSPDVTTTVLEMLPLAEHLTQTGQSVEVYQAAQKQNFKGQCVFYHPDKSNPMKGRCSVYELRPGICRLWGFSARTDKKGKKILMTCGLIRKNQPMQCEKGQQIIDSGGLAPMMRDYVGGFEEIDPGQSQRLLAINTALKEALERVSLRKEIG